MKYRILMMMLLTASLSRAEHSDMLLQPPEPAPGAAAASNANPNFDYLRDCRPGGEGLYRFTWRGTVQNLLARWAADELNAFHPHDGEIPLVSDLNRRLNDADRFWRWYENGRQQHITALQTRFRDLSHRLRGLRESAQRRGLSLDRAFEREADGVMYDFRRGVGGDTGARIRAYEAAQYREMVAAKHLATLHDRIARNTGPPVSPQDIETAETALTEAEAEVAQTWEPVRGVYELGFLHGISADNFPAVLSELRSRNTSPEIMAWVQLNPELVLRFVRSLPLNQQIAEIEEEASEVAREMEEQSTRSDEAGQLVAHLLRHRARVPFVLSLQVMERQQFALPFNQHLATLALCSSQFFQGRKSGSALVHISETSPVCDAEERGALRRGVRSLFHEPPTSEFPDEISCTQSPSLVRPVVPEMPE